MTTKIFSLLTICLTCCFTPSDAQDYNIYISDAGNFNNPPWQILKFDDDGQNGRVFISQHLDWPQDIFFLENENSVLISNLNNGRITKFDATSGAYKGEFATGIGAPTRMRLGPDGLLYVLQWQGNGKVWRYTLQGSFVDEFTSAGVVASIGLDWDTAGNLYVSSYTGKYVRKFSPDGNDLGNFISTNLSGPTNIWFEDNGDLLVMDYNGSSVKRFDSEGRYKGVFISGLPQGEGVDFLPNGNLVIGCGGTSSVREYSPTGTLIKNLVPPKTLQLLKPNAVVLRPVVTVATHEITREEAFVTPSVGVRFLVSHSEALKGVSILEVYNAAGVLVGKINFTESTTWDASHLSSGIYHIRAKMADGAIGRQTVVVQP